MYQYAWSDNTAGYNNIGYTSDQLKINENNLYLDHDTSDQLNFEKDFIEELKKTVLESIKKAKSPTGRLGQLGKYMKSSAVIQRYYEV